MRAMTFQLGLGLILGNLLWSAHPLMGKWVLQDFSPGHLVWMRYTSALLTYLLIAPFFKQRGRHFPKLTFKGYGLALISGVSAFAVGPLLQVQGLQDSQATDNAIIIAMEPIFTVLLARIVLGERMTVALRLSFVAAFVGFTLLSQLSTDLNIKSMAHLSMLVSLVGEATYAVLSRKLHVYMTQLQAFFIAIIAGVTALSLYCLPAFGLPHLEHFHLRSVIGILWLGPLGTTGGYLFWTYALGRANVASVVLSLFIQPVFGAIWGVVFLGDHLSFVQWSGAALIAFSVAIQNAAPQVKIFLALIKNKFLYLTGGGGNGVH